MWPVLVLHLTPCHRQQSWPRHDLSRPLGSLVMPALKDSNASFSAVMQLPLNFFATLERDEAAMVVDGARRKKSRRHMAAAP